MANSDDVALQGEILKAHAEAACTQARTLVAQYSDLIEAIAATEERVAETMDRVAAQQPTRASHCRARGQQAREQAALWRQRGRAVGVRPRSNWGYAPALVSHYAPLTCGCEFRGNLLVLLAAAVRGITVLCRL